MVRSRALRRPCHRLLSHFREVLTEQVEVGYATPVPPAPPQTFLDADRVLAMSVGLLETDLRYDVWGETPDSSADGKVTARDAQVIAKQAATAVRRGRQ